MVYRMQLTYDETIDILNLKDIPSKIRSYSIQQGLYEVSDLNKTLQKILPDNVKVIITTDNIRLRYNLKINQTLLFTKKSFFIQN